GGGGAGRRAVPFAAASLYAGLAQRGAQARLLPRRSANQAGGNPRRRAEPQAAHRGLRIREPLRIRPRPVPARGARAGGEGAGPFRRLPFRRQGNGGRMSPVLLEVNDLKKHFPLRGSLLRPSGLRVYAVDGVSFRIDKGETWARAGRSGCAKPTVGRAIRRRFDITAGQVGLDGTRIDDMPAGSLRPLRRRMQVVSQDPISSPNPRMRVRDLLAEPIRN